MASGFNTIIAIVLLLSCAKWIHGNKENSTTTSTSSQANPMQKRFEKSESARSRKYYISNRDSYVDAANSFGNSNSHPMVANRPNQQSHSHGAQQPMNSYQVPQSSYGVPDYGMQMSGQGWGSYSGKSLIPFLTNLILHVL